MKKVFFALAFISFIVSLSSCSNESDVNRLGYTRQEKEKIETMKALFKSYGWKIDPNVSDEERNQELLKANPDSIKALLQMLQDDKMDYSDTLNTEIPSKDLSLDFKTQRGYPSKVLIKGEHHCFFAVTFTFMELQYNPNRDMLTVTGTTVDTGLGNKWSPSNPGSFCFDGSNTCNVSASGILSVMGHKGMYTMWGHVDKQSNGKFGGKIEHFRLG